MVEPAEGDLDVVEERDVPWRTGVGSLGDLRPDADPPPVTSLRVRKTGRTSTSAPDSLPATLVSTGSNAAAANTELSF